MAITKRKKKIGITEKSKIRVRWTDKRENFSKEKEREIIKYIKNKYKVKYVVVDFNPTNSLKLGAIDMGTGKVEDINSNDVQERIITEWLKENKIDIEIGDIKRLNKRIESEMGEIESKDNEIILKSLSMSNFLSYGEDPTFFDFEKLKGITLINGANFSGKTTVLHAFIWLLFGTIEKAKKQEDVINAYNGATSCWVEGELVINGVAYKIRREVKRKIVKKTNTFNGSTSSLSIFTKNIDGEYEENDKEEDRRATEKVIKEYIGNLEDFLMTVICTGDNIFDIIKTKPTQRGEMLTRYLGLEIFARKGEFCKNKFKEWKVKADLGKYSSVELAIQIENNDTEILTKNEELRENLPKKDELEIEKKILDLELIELTGRIHKDIDESIARQTDDSFLKAIQEAIDNVNNKKIKLSELKNSFKDNLEEFKEDEYKDNLSKITVLEGDIKNIESEIRLIEDANKDIKNKITNLETENKYNTRDMVNLRQIIKNLQEGDTCQECGQKLANVDHSGVIKEKISEGLAKKAEVEGNASKIEAHKVEIDNNITKINNLRPSITVVENEIKEINKLNEILLVNKELITKNDLVALSIDKVEVEIELGSNNVSKQEELYEKFKLDKDKILENHTTRDLINTKQYEITRNSERRSVIDRNITIIEQRLEALDVDNERLDKLLTKIKREEHSAKVFEVYIDMMGKNGISKSILKSSVPILNMELKKLLNDSAEFSVEIEINETNNEVEFWLVDNESGVRNYLISGSGYEKTIASLAIRVVNSKINTLPKPSLLMVDEVFSTVDNENMELVKIFLDKVAKEIDNVILITHNELTKEWADNIITVSKENKVSKVSF